MPRGKLIEIIHYYLTSGLPAADYQRLGDVSAAVERFAKSQQR